MEDFKVFMRGIYSESVNDFTSDESLMAYKQISDIQIFGFYYLGDCHNCHQMRRYGGVDKNFRC